MTSRNWSIVASWPTMILPSSERTCAASLFTDSMLLIALPTASIGLLLLSARGKPQHPCVLLEGLHQPDRLVFVQFRILLGALAMLQRLNKAWLAPAHALADRDVELFRRGIAGHSQPLDQKVTKALVGHFDGR